MMLRTLRGMFCAISRLGATGCDFLNDKERMKKSEKLLHVQEMGAYTSNRMIKKFVKNSMKYSGKA